MLSLLYTDNRKRIHFMLMMQACADILKTVGIRKFLIKWRSFRGELNFISALSIVHILGTEVCIQLINLLINLIIGWRSIDIKSCHPSSWQALVGAVSIPKAKIRIGASIQIIVFQRPDPKRVEGGEACEKGRPERQTKTREAVDCQSSDWVNYSSWRSPLLKVQVIHDN